MPSETGAVQFSGRCYCGASRIIATAPPDTVAYCHCADCRRWTGAPVGAFAAFADAAVSLEPAPASRSHAPGVTRWVCPDCGSPLAARFAYLPGQTYVPVGIIDQADTLRPALHCHVDAALPWLHVADDLPRVTGSGRASLQRPGGA